MKPMIDTIGKVLSGEVSPKDGANRIRQFLDKADPLTYSQSTCLYRLCLALQDRENGTGSWWDVAGHLRQAILNFKQRFPLKSEWVTILKPLGDAFGLRFEDEQVDATLAIPSWLGTDIDFKALYDFLERHRDESVLGDALLYQMSGYTRYSSPCQKAVVQASLNMKPGQTLLACLPTGGGKSLVGQLPAFLETEGGRLDGGITTAGTTLVVVPTTALAQDQARAVRPFFRDARDEEHRPKAYYSDLNDTEKSIIRKGLLKGTIPLLYTSPEALVNGSLFELTMEAAASGRINRLVIDEAHIVVDWGSNFRMDFQFLAWYRKKLLAQSQGRLKTLLLSATLTDRTVPILRELFSENDQWLEIRGDALRPEPMYFFNRSESDRERRQKVLELLPLLPRPLICYVSLVEQARNWYKAIKQAGFTRVRLFTSRTSNRERERIIEAWNADEVDIIVATSAFGMGVDKRDVRTVLHVGLPESINRFYQEVGRGGRDGFPSLSVLCLNEKDKLTTWDLIKSSVLTAENMGDRWTRMRMNALEQVQGDAFWLDTDMAPTRLIGDKTGQRNANFNEQTLLFLYRMGLIDLLELRPGNNEQRRHVLVKMLDLNILENPTALQAVLAPARDEEWGHVKGEYNRMKDLFKSKRGATCWAERFSDVYPLALQRCGGCPECRRQGLEPYEKSGDFLVYGTMPRAKVNLGGKVRTFLGLYPELWVEASSPLLLPGKEALNLTEELIHGGIGHFIVLTTRESWEDALTKLPWRDGRTWTLWESSELANQPESYAISGPVVLFYPQDELDIDQLYQWSQNYLQCDPGNRVLHVATRETLILSENRYLPDLIEGNRCRTTHLLRPSGTGGYDFL